MDDRIKTVFSRCPVGTATELSIKKGWLQEALLNVNAEFTLLQSLEEKYHSVHFTQEYPLHFRDGGNIPPMWAQSHGDRSVLLGVSYQHEARGIFVHNDSDIQSVEQLKGKTIAIPVREDAVIDFRFLTAMRGVHDILEYAGIKMDEVNIQYIPCKNIKDKRTTGLDTLNKDSDFMTEDFVAVLEGKVDAVFDHSIKAVRHDQAGIVRDILAEDEKKNIKNINNNAVLAITCTKPFAYEHPEIVVTYLKEVIKAGRYAGIHHEDFLDAAASGVYGATPAEMALSFDNDYLFNRVPELSEKSFELLSDQKEFIIKCGKICRENDFDVRDWADKSFLDKALQELDSL